MISQARRFCLKQESNGNCVGWHGSKTNKQTDNQAAKQTEGLEATCNVY